MEEVESDEKVTHYLTYFNIFPSEKLFQDYQIFLQKLVIQLGQDWRIQSNILWDGQENGEGYPHIFNIFLSVFLENRLNKEYSSDLILDSDEIVQQQKSIQRFNEVKMNQNKEKNKDKEESKSNIKIGQSLTFQTLSVGFFVIAAEIWNGIFIEGRRCFQQKSVAQLKPFATSIEYEPSQTIKKLRKLSNTISKNIKSRLENSQFISHSQSRFSREVSSTQVVSKQLKQSKQTAKNVTWKNFKLSLSELSPSLLSKAKQQLQSRQQFSKQQILSNFVVNILEIEQSNKKLKKQLNSSQSKPQKEENQQLLIRIIRLNKQFYNNCTIIWLLINNKKNYLMKYNQYQNFVRSIFQQSWKPEYNVVLKLLFDILTKQWNQITKQHAINLNEDYEVMKIFIERLKKSLTNTWNSVLSQISLQLLQI